MKRRIARDRTCRGPAATRIVRPRWLVAKSGITSSDVATSALAVKRAVVLGPALPRVPVWRIGKEARWPALGYVMFPGNVGGGDALRWFVESLGQ